jgi:hypothetical protein
MPYCTALCVCLYPQSGERLLLLDIYIIKADLELICDDPLLWKNLRQRLIIINPS